MPTIVQLLRQRGFQMPNDLADGPTAYHLRAVFDSGRAEVESDADGSRRITLSEQYDQLTLSRDGELIVVHTELDRDRFDSNERTVFARTTAKAANELTKLRLWQAVEAGLRQAGAIRTSGHPATLLEWLEQNKDEADKLRQQVNTIGLAAEKTHDCSAQAFQPALLASFTEREGPLKRAIAAYFTAEALRRRILAEAGKRLSEKRSSDPEERRYYLARKEKLSARAAQLYGAAKDLFAQANARSLAHECEHKAIGHSSTAAAPGSPANSGRAEMRTVLQSVLAKSEYALTRRLLEPDDLTWKNTVRAINALKDPKSQGSLEMYFASHLIEVARRLKTPDEVALLLMKINDLKKTVAQDSFINHSRIDRYSRLIVDERPDVLPVLKGPIQGRTSS